VSWWCCRQVLPAWGSGQRGFWGLARETPPAERPEHKHTSLRCALLWQGTGLHAAAILPHQKELWRQESALLSCGLYRCRWDYGYQTTAMANRTVIVDNNTWNTSHIATVGRAMSSSGKSRGRQRPQMCIMQDSHVWNLYQLQTLLATCNMPCTVHMRLTASPMRKCT